MYYIGLGCQSAVLAGLYKIRPSDPLGVKVVDSFEITNIDKLLVVKENNKLIKTQPYIVAALTRDK